ncbi:MAG: hypothetical protein AAF304_04255 [Pseudomonadota bacterium]
MKSLSVMCITFLVSSVYASEVEKIEPIIIEPSKIETIEVQAECPQGSQHAGEILPEWVIGEESIEYFCNSNEEETELAE